MVLIMSHAFLTLLARILMIVTDSFAIFWGHLDNLPV